MTKKMKSIIAVLAISTSASMASISLDFNVASTNTGPNRLNAGGSLVFDFAVDGSGNVTLDATTGSADVTTLAVVNGWDGNVGTVSEASLFNTTFQLTASGSTASISLDGADTGGLGVFGQNASRIDGATLATPKIESLVWTITDGAVDVSFSQWVYTGSPNNIGDITVFDANTTTNFYNMAGTTGTKALSGFSISGNEALTFTEPSNGTHGAALGGMTFEVIPEPATLGLVVAFGGGILFVRRRFML